MAATKLQEQQRAAREAVGATAQVVPGRARYQALTNLSVPQRTDAGVLTGQNDIVTAGETVELDEREARNLMATGGHTGRQHPAIRPVGLKSDPLPRLHPQQLSGMLRAPVVPPPDSDLPRPDPPGSSAVRVIDERIPEGAEPQPGAEQVPLTGAMDLPPRGTR